MNKKIILAFTLTILLMPCSVFADVQESTINVETTVNSELPPDTVKIKFYVENSGANLADIKQKNDKIVNSAINVIKTKLNKDESIRTIAFRVNDIYSYKDRVRVFQKYEVVNGFEIKLKDLDKISQIIKLAMDNGVKRVDGINFSIENGQNACNELMAQSIKQAKERASYLASAAGNSVLKVKNINPYCSLNSNFVQPRFYTNSMAKATLSDTAEEAMGVIEPGSINIRAGVNMTYYLK